MSLPVRKYVVPEIVFGVGALDLLGHYCSNFKAQHILIVTDTGVIEAGWLEKISEILGNIGLIYSVYSNVSENPLVNQVMEGAKLYEAKNCDVIVALGGGSPIDCAKAIGVVSTNNKHILEFEGVDNVEVPGPPLICIPTTAGSAADISQFAIINNPIERVKIAIISKAMVPDIALVDPSTTLTMDNHLTACTGIDVLTHAVEAYVSLASSPITDMHSLEAIKNIVSFLPKVVENPVDALGREKVMLASMQAGMAFSNASLGAVHAMAHSLGGYYGLAHGECNALLLEHVVAFNYHSSITKYETIGKVFGVHHDNMPPNEQNAALSDAFRNFREILGISGSLQSRGISSEDFSLLAGKALHDPCMITNPLQLELDEIVTIFRNAF